MLKLTNKDIALSQSASDKTEAIKNIAQHLTDKGLVKSGYVDGMLNRESQNSTFLGSGIAIPHGTTDTRNMVKATGVTVHHFPQGVDWGDGNTVYVAIGIAAKSDEHLGILKQLTKVLSHDNIENHLRQIKNEDDVIALLQGETQQEIDFDASLIQLQFPASDMVQMSAVAAGLLKNTGCAESGFVADLVAKVPTHLGQGLWLTSSNKQVLRSGVSFVSTANDCEFNGEKVRALIAIATCNNAHQPVIQTLSEMVFKGEQQRLIESSAEQLISLLKGTQTTSSEATVDTHVAVFKIKNTHGLHARPGAMLVAEAKKFEANIDVANLDSGSDTQAVNAKSLMKVISLGAKHGHQLQFTATGPDASQALESIGQAIASGLSEG